MTWLVDYLRNLKEFFSPQVLPDQVPIAFCDFLTLNQPDLLRDAKEKNLGSIFKPHE